MASRHLRPRKDSGLPKPNRKLNGKKLYFPWGYMSTIRKYGRGRLWTELTPKERGLTARRIRGGRNRNKFWKSIGYPNLKKALEVRLAKREERLRLGLISPQKAARLAKVAAQEVKPVSVKEERSAEIFETGRVQRERGRPMLGGLVAAGLYDPGYLMRREMRILEVMGRCPA